MLAALVMALAVLSQTPVVQDGANVLDTAQVSQRLAEVQSATGVTMGVLTLPASGSDLKPTALQFINQRGLGQNSVVIVLSLSPKKVFVQPGSTLAGTFTTGLTTSLVRTSMVPSLRQGDYLGGILSGISAIQENLPTAGTSSPVYVPPSAPRPVLQMAPVQVTASPTEESHVLRNLFLLLLLGGGVFLIVRALRLAAQRRRDEEEAVALRQSQLTHTIYPDSSAPNDSAAAIINGAAATKSGVPQTSQAAPVTGGGTTVINNGGGSNNGLLTGLLLGNVLSRSGPSVVEHHHHDRSGQSGGGGSGSSYTPDSGGGGSSYDDSSSGGGSSYDSDSSGGGSSYDSGGGSSYDSGGGGSFDGGSSGGGGSDF